MFMILNRINGQRGVTKMVELSVYGEKSFVKKIFVKPVKKVGFVDLGIPNKGYDLNEEEL